MGLGSIGGNPSGVALPGLVPANASKPSGVVSVESRVGLVLSAISNSKIRATVIERFPVVDVVAKAAVSEMQTHNLSVHINRHLPGNVVRYGRYGIKGMRMPTPSRVPMEMADSFKIAVIYERELALRKNNLLHRSPRFASGRRGEHRPQSANVVVPVISRDTPSVTRRSS